MLSCDDPSARFKLINMQKVQTYDGNTTVGFVSGLLGGAGSFLLDIKIGLMSDMLVAVLTAFLCGFAGIAAKEAVQYCKSIIKKKRKHEKTI